jgi:hypothetical protein
MSFKDSFIQYIKEHKTLYALLRIPHSIFLFFYALIRRILIGISLVISVFFSVFISLYARYRKKPYAIGLGPEPLINNVYHKKALELYGYSAQTFVTHVYFITQEFDVRLDQRFSSENRVINLFYKCFFHMLCHAYVVLNYECVYIYFNGGIFFPFPWFWKIEPFLYRLAQVKVVVLPYGGDVQEMTRSPNLLFKHTQTESYPFHTKFRRKIVEEKIDLWTVNADHVISGCEWVDYMYHWDTLMLAHFSIDTQRWKPLQNPDRKEKKIIRIFHAPNHRFIKGTDFFIRAVDELRAEGYPVELVLREKIPNDEIKKEMESVDIVADQLIVGWYAMFALEAMAMEKPVLCYIREDLENLYVCSNLIEEGELPLVKCTPLTVKETIRHLIENPASLEEIGRRSRQFVIKHHSIEAVGSTFDRINTSFGLKKRKPAIPPES